MTSKEQDLRAGLIEWRNVKMVEEDLDGDTFFGPQLIMSNKILDRIIDLAHYAKLTTPASILEQTGWCYSLDYGSQIIELIQAYFPPPPEVLPPPPAVLSPSTTINQTNSGISTVATLPGNAESLPAAEGANRNSKRAARKCRACGSNLHICASHILNHATMSINTRC